MVNHEIAASHLRHDSVFKNFKLEFDAIKERKKKEVTTPQISQKLDIVCLNEAFINFLSRIVGARKIPLDLFVRTIDNANHEESIDLIIDTFCVEDAGSLEE